MTNQQRTYIHAIHAATFLFSALMAASNTHAQQRSHFQARASEIDPRCKEYPKIGYVFKLKNKVQDTQNATVNVKVKSRGQLVIWMMAYKSDLSNMLADWGFHVIQPHYARQWFSKVCRENPVGEHCRGNMRLEAATGEDFSKSADLAQPDGMKERVRQYLLWLTKKHPEGKWDQFLSANKKEIRWDKVIMSGASHGSTTSARFAKHQKVARVVMFCGPRDQYQSWQALPSATPKNRYFGFSHVKDGGWAADHYCRSWELLGLNAYGAMVNIDQAKTPYDNTRRLISDLSVGDAKKAHSCVTPGKASPKDKNGKYLYEPVWKYMFTHPIDKVGQAVPQDDDCCKDQRARDFK